MNQKIKKRFHKCVCLFMVFGLLSLTGCSKEEKQTINPNQISTLGGLSETKDGIYHTSTYKNSDNVMLKYYDKAEKKDVALCNKANCNHDNKECLAWILGNYKDRNLFMIANYKNKLYLYYIDLIGSKNTFFMVADMDGSNRKELYELPKSSAVNAALLYRDKMFLSYNSFGMFDEMSGGITATTLHVYDIKKAKETQIATTKKGEDGYLYFLGAEGDQVFYINDVFANETKPIYAYNLKDKQIKLINDENKISTSMLYKDELFYADINTNELMAYHIFDKSTRSLSTFTPHEGELIQNSSDGIVNLQFVTDFNTKNSKQFTQVYDVAREKFLFPDFVGNYDISQHYDDGYLGDVDFRKGIFDKHMKFTAFE